MKPQTKFAKKTHRFALVAFAMAGFALVANPAFGQAAKKGSAPRAIKQYTIEQFLTTTAIGGSSFSPDEKSILFSSNKSGIYNVYSIPVSGGEPKQLTRSTTESTFSVGYFPNDSRILYTHDQGGNENNHIYVMGSDGKERDLTPGDKLKAQFLGWTHDGKAFYISTNERDQRYFDIYKLDAPATSGSCCIKTRLDTSLAISRTMRSSLHLGNQTQPPIRMSTSTTWRRRK